MHGRRITAADWVVALVAVAWITIEDLSWDAAAPPGVRVATGVATVGAMLFARRAPIAVGLWVTCGLLLRCALDAQPFENAMPLACSLALSYLAAWGACGRRDAILRGVGSIGPFLVAEATVEPLRTWNDTTGLVVMSGFLACSWAVGWAVRCRWIETRALTRDRAALERSRAAELRAATAEERARIARELHAIVSAATARIRAAAEAAARLLPVDVRAADVRLAEAQHATHTTLDDVRRLLRVLRAEPSEAPAAVEDAPLSRLRIWAMRLVPVVAFAAIGIIDHLRSATDGPVLSDAVLAVLPALPLAWRHRAPLASALSALVVFDLLVIAGETAVITFSSWSLTGMAGWICARHLGGLKAATGIALAFIQLELLLAFGDAVITSDVIFVTLWAGVGTAAGIVVRRRVLEAERSRRKHDEALEARSRELEAALAGERRAIAREMHDVVGHALTLLAIHAGAARRYVERDPDAAAAHVDVMRGAAADAEVELVRLLATIEGPLGGDAEPQPSAADVGALARAAGAAVRLEWDPAAVPPSLGLAAYRIVQEALTNARKHAPGATVAVHARHAAGTVAIEVLSGPPRGRAAALSAGGHGLVGMAERARLFGGTLEARATGDGGWLVRVELPAGHVPEVAVPEGSTAVAA